MSIKNLEIKPSEAKAVEIASLPTRPTSSATYGGRGLTAQEMKKAYDAYPALIKERFNALIADLLSGIAINDIPFSIPSHEPFGENIEQTVKGFLDAVGAILDFGTDDARTIFGFVKQFISNVAKATSLEYDKITQLLSLTIDGEKKSVKIDLDEFKNEIADLKESKLDKTGGTISGNLEVTGNLTVLGKTIQTVLEKLNVKDAVIVTNADGSTLTVLSGFATRTGADTTYGIMYDPASDSVKLGIVTVDENGVYHFADGEGSPVATRADSANMSDGKVVTWNAAKRRMETTEVPAAVDEQPSEGSQNLITSGAVSEAKSEAFSFAFETASQIDLSYNEEKEELTMTRTVENKVIPLTGVIALKDRVDFLSTLLFNTIITNTTVEDTYTTRVTAGGLPVVSNTPTTVHKIAGETKASENLLNLADKIVSTEIYGVTVTANNNKLTFSGTPSRTSFSYLSSDIDLSDYVGKTLTFSQSPTFTAWNSSGAIFWQVYKDGAPIGNSANTDGTLKVDIENGHAYKARIWQGGSTDAVNETISFMVNEGTTALPYSDYYAGLKNASFKSVTSTGSNLFDLSVADGTYGGITISSNNNKWTLSGTPTSQFATLKAVTLPSWIGGKTITISQSKYFASYNEAGAVYISIVKVSPWSTVATSITGSKTVTLEEGATYRLLIMNGNTSSFEKEYVSFMVNLGQTASTYSDYIVPDTSFQFSTARQLRKWDYIDVDNQRLVTGTAEVTQDTAFTDEELAAHPDYIISADRKTIAYPLETPTTAPLTVPKSYTAWRNGSETVDTGATDALPPTITQTYYEEVTSA